MAAFSQLHLSRGYAQTTVRNVVQLANVGRSTFYEHFRSKEDILAACMMRFFSSFVACVGAAAPPEALVRVLKHLWENRRLTDAVFTGAPRAVLARSLAAALETRLSDMERDNRSRLLVPTRLAAAQLAEAQLALTEAWLRGKAAASPESLAAALHRTSDAAARALLSD